MGLIPKMVKCCGCYSLKTGSFTIAFLLLVGSAVQTGYYGYLIQHAKPIEMCTEWYTNVHRVFVYEMLPSDESVRFWSPFFSFDEVYSDHHMDRSLLESDEPQELPERATENNIRGETEASAVNSTDAAKTDVAMKTTTSSTLATTKAPWNPYRGYSRPRGTWVRRRTQHSYITPCRKPPRTPFDIDVNFLNFDYSGSLDKASLYFNLCIFGTLMCFSPLLMCAVYKESRGLLLWWLVAETTLLAAAVAGTVAASVSLFKVLQVSVGIVTLVNMAFHLAIDIYYVMVVVNFREKLEIKDEDETEEIQI